MESVNSSTNFDTGCQNIVDSLISNSKHIYFIELQIGAHYIMIAQSVSDSYGSYIVFGYYSVLKYCSKREGIWQQVVSL